METFSILQDMYEEVDILAFSTGCNLAIYTLQFDWRCKIRNVILACPNFVVHPSERIFKFLLNTPILSNFIINLYPITQKPARKRRKHSGNIKDKTFNNKLYEAALPTYSVQEVWRFQDILPDTINADNIIILKSNNDRVVGDICKQKIILETIYKKEIDIIYIPPQLDDDKVKVSHDIFNSSKDIVQYIYYKIYHLIEQDIT